MSFKKLFIVLLLFVGGFFTAQAQELLLGADFTTHFDNREYADMTFDESQTIFAARLSPFVGVEWMQKNRFVVGAELLQNFGQHTAHGDRFLTDVKPVMYYRFKTPKVQAVAGIFTRDELMGDYSAAFFSDSTVFFHNRLSGFMGRYVSQKRPDTYVEAWIDWEGMQGEDSREKFRIVTAGRYTMLSGIYFGYAFSMFHFAGATNNKNVNDNMLGHFYVGWHHKTRFDYDLKAGLVMAPQRARTAKPGWNTPKGAQIDLKISRWGLKLENNLYLGENLQPYLDVVSNVEDGTSTFRQEGFYAGERFYSTREHIYNRTWIGYTHSFFKGSLAVDAGMVFHYDGTGLGSQQVVKLSLKLERLFRLGGRAAN